MGLSTLMCHLQAEDPGKPMVEFKGRPESQRADGIDSNPDLKIWEPRVPRAGDQCPSLRVRQLSCTFLFYLAPQWIRWSWPPLGLFVRFFFFLTTSISSMVIGLFRFLFEPVFLVETLSMNLCISSQLSYLGYKIIISFYHLLQCLRAL